MSEKTSHKFEQPIATEMVSKQSAEKLKNKDILLEDSETRLKNNLDNIHKNIEKQALSKESIKIEQEAEDQSPAYNYLSNKVKASRYAETVRQVQQKLTPSQRKFSTFIHQPIIETISEIGSKTIARPSGILGGALTAIIASSIILFVARQTGFKVPNSIFITLYITGFIFGLIIEYIIKLLNKLSPIKHKKHI